MARRCRAATSSAPSSAANALIIVGRERLSRLINQILTFSRIERGAGL
jgi:signal transduction histidine kinase